MVEEEYAKVVFLVKLSVPEKVFESPSNVDDAAPERDVRKLASLVNQLSLTDDEAIG